MAGRIGKFLLPDETLTLKVVFDNVKHYALCGGLAGVSEWAFKHVDHSKIPTNGPVFLIRDDLLRGDFLEIAAWSLVLLSAFLSLMTLCQTYAIFSRLFNVFGDRFDNLHPVKEGSLLFAVTLVAVPIIYIVLFGLVAAVNQLLYQVNH
jgi:hypothetical protein